MIIDNNYAPVNHAQGSIDRHNELLLAEGKEKACYDIQAFNSKGRQDSKKTAIPYSNTGVINSKTTDIPVSIPTHTHVIDRCLHTKKVDFNGHVLRLPLSAPDILGGIPENLPVDDAVVKCESSSPDLAFLDYLSFSFKVGDYYKAFPDSKAVSNDGDDLVSCISSKLFAILGFGVTTDRGYGQFNYKRSWQLGNGLGLFMLGGNAETAFISLTGQSLTAALEGFEYEIYNFMVAVQASITRVDLAHDIFDGFGYSVDECRQDYLDDRFYVKGARPKGEMKGNWDYIDGKGRSYYVGSRAGGKMLRVYEKGLQLGGDVASLYKGWVRIEVELKKTSSRPVLPLDIVINAGHYLAGSYPALSFLSDVQKRIISTRSAVKVTVEKIKKYVEVSCANSLSFVYRVLCDGDDGDFMDYLKKKVFKSEQDFPKRLLTVMPSLKPELPVFEPSKPFDDFAFNDDDKVDSFGGVLEYVADGFVYVRGVLNLCKFDISRLCDIDINSFSNKQGQDVIFEIDGGWALSGVMPC